MLKKDSKVGVYSEPSQSFKSSFIKEQLYSNGVLLSPKFSWSIYTEKNWAKLIWATSNYHEDPVNDFNWKVKELGL